MKFDFHQQFIDYSTIDLLKILKDPGNYQPEAIEAARAILAERTVTEQDLAKAEKQVADDKYKAQELSRTIDAYKTKAGDFLQPVIRPSDKTDPVKWLNILLLFLVIQYVWLTYTSVKEILFFLKCSYCSFDIVYIITFINLLYIPLLLFLLFKRKRWGWILLFADNLLALILRLGQSYFFFKYQEYHQDNSVEFLFFLMVRAAFVFFLWKKSIADLFHATERTKKETLQVVGALGIAIVILTFYLAW